MALKKVGKSTWLLSGGSNVGFAVVEGKAIVVDSGLDRDSARQVARALEGLGAKACALIITHAHADHFGGAAALKERFGVKVFAPEFETAVVENPILEPLWLFGGAWPVKALQGKFTLARPCRVDELINEKTVKLEELEIKIQPLPGHSPGQIGLIFEDTFFCADSFFPLETLAKHGIPYCTDMDSAIATLKKFEESFWSCEYFIPGHGEALQNPAPLAEANRRRLEEIRGKVMDLLRSPSDETALMRGVAQALNFAYRDLTHYYLCRTTIYAALTSLEKEGVVEAFVEGNNLLWRRV
ncbi:MAG: MBL fold metallo-hydrolase [Anaerolineae bacterium]|nr:MBL fold metallo-hydrolase [Anaerolineae bacterium]MDW8101888.1 MBL fold metallo-hydrolase [Anaerolineae bacterium]